MECIVLDHPLVLLVEDLRLHNAQLQIFLDMALPVLQAVLNGNMETFIADATLIRFTADIGKCKLFRPNKSHGKIYR